MSVKQQTVQRTTEHTIVVETTCDICGCTAGHDVAAIGRWSDNAGSFASATMTFVEGAADRDGGGWTERTTYDVCPRCWRYVVARFMNSRGIKPRRERIET